LRSKGMHRNDLRLSTGISQTLCPPPGTQIGDFQARRNASQ
jgi:hypothetical protein